MALDERTADAVGYLLRLVDEATAGRVRARLALGAEGAGSRRAGDDWDPQVRRQLRAAPASVRFWLLQADDPAVNRLLFDLELLPPGLNHDVVGGVAFAPGSPDRGRSGVLRHDLPAFGPDDPRRGRETDLPGILAALYAAEAAGKPLRPSRRAAAEVRSAYWPEILAAHRAEPLPGYARWALAERIDCPAELRASFGTHPKFANRLRSAGIIEELGDLVTAVEPARAAMPLLSLVSRIKPGAVAAGVEVLRPLVDAELGRNVEAWAVLAQLLPEFVGSVAELLPLAGAVAGPMPEEPPSAGPGHPGPAETGPAHAAAGSAGRP